MKNKMKKTTLLGIALIATFAFFTSCSKDSTTTTTTTPETNTQKLVGKNWFMSAAIMNPGIPDGTGGTITDFYALMEDCSKDDFMNFNANGTYISDEGLTMCDSTSAQTTPGTWKFTNNETNILIDDSTNLGILQLEASMMKLKLTENIGGTDQTISYTFIKK
jgi:hypothetical protein